jgi:drug/metabolite transporter (DMT)-like permease
MRVNNLQAIVFNYITCVITGSLFNGRFPVDDALWQQSWLPWAAGMGVFFISLFNIVAFTAQRMGVAVTSVAYKLSLVIPFLFSVYLYNERITSWRITGVVLALAAVVFTCYPAKQELPTGQKKISPLMWLMPFLLFVGSGLLDTMIKYVEQRFLNSSNQNDYLIIAFMAAGGTGLMILLIGLFTGRQQFNPKAILAGIMIGVPNYFSIWCLLQALKGYTGNSSAIIPINNMGIVLFSAVVAWLLFKEKLSFINWLGIGLSLGAIALIAYG